MLISDWSSDVCSSDLLVDGLLYAFPRRMGTVAGRYPKVMALHARVAHLPALQAYFSSGRRLPFGDGIFRYYPELDGDRSEERRVGKECVSTCRSRWSPTTSKKKIHTK